MGAKGNICFMSNSKRYNRVVSIVLNIFIILFEIYVLIINLTESGAGIFLFFTDISNFFALIASCCYVVYFIFFFSHKNSRAPLGLVIIKYFSCCMMLLTLLVVAFVLASVGGGLCAEFVLFFGTMLFTHTVCPIILIISFIFFEKDIQLKFKYVWFSLLPPIIYGLAIICLDLARVVVAPYTFLRISERSLFLNLVWILALIVGMYCLNLVIYLLKRVKQKTKHTT